MKKCLLAVLLLFIAQTITAQVVSISPNRGFSTTTLRTTITLAPGVMQVGSPPVNINDIYLEHSLSHTRIYPDSYDPTVNIYPQGSWPPSDSFYVDFTFSSTDSEGFYDVHAICHLFDWVSQTWSDIDHSLLSGFALLIDGGSVEGTVYYDANQDGIRDVGEFGLANQLLNVQPGNTTALSDANGHYVFYLDSGSYTVNYTPQNSFTQTSLPASYPIHVQPNHTGLDFGAYTPNSQIFDHEFSVWKTTMRCNAAGYSNYTLHNNGVGPIHQGTVTIIHSNNLSFVTSTFAPISINGDTLTFSYSNLGPGQTIQNQITYLNPPAGNTVYYTVIDSLYDDNGVFIFEYRDFYSIGTICSWDPNDKGVSPPGEQAQNYTLMNSELVYTINFQNLGNDTAFIVNIYDTLDADLDLSTIRVISSSDPVQLNMTSTGALRFLFENINLPHNSIDSTGSHGYVMYGIHPLGNLPDPTVIENTAHIVFDFNPAVITNTTFNTLVNTIPTGIESSVSNNQVLVYPNPVSDRSMLIFPNQGNKKFTLTVTDFLGRVIVKQNSIDKMFWLDKNILGKGLFIYELENLDQNIRYTGKFVVIN